MARPFGCSAVRVVQHEIDHLDGKLNEDRNGAVFIPKKRQNFSKNFFRKNRVYMS